MPASVRENVNRIRGLMPRPTGSVVAEALESLFEEVQAARIDIDGLSGGLGSLGSTRIAFYPPPGSPYPSSITRLLNEKVGEIPSIMDFGARGDFKEVSDAAITATSAVLTSATANFSAHDAGKRMMVAGAGAAGVPLATTISLITSSTQVTLSAAAGTTVSGAKAGWGTDDAAAINTAIASCSELGRTLQVPSRKYLIASAINMLDKSRFSMFGHGPNSVFVPWGNWPAATNVFNLSGSLGLELAFFTVDCRYLVHASRDLAAFYAEATATTPTFGRLFLHHLHLLNCQQHGLHVECAAGRTVQDVSIADCRFLDMGAAGYGANAIRFSGPGTRERISVSRNDLRLSVQPSATKMSTIFVGHGTSQDILIGENIIDSPALDGIEVRRTPSGTEATAFSGLLVSLNSIRKAGNTGITLYGTSNASVIGNALMNAGQDAAAATRAGVYVEYGITGAATQTPAINVGIVGNTIVDDQGTPTMLYGVNLLHSATAIHTGVLSANRINGQINRDVLISPDDGTHQWAVLLSDGKQFGMNKRNPLAPFDIKGDIRVEPSSQAFNPVATLIFNRIIADANIAAGGNRLGLGMNVYFDGTNWITGADSGSNNGAGAILTDYVGSELELYIVTNTGTGSQSITPATFDSTHLAVRITGNGVRIPRSLSVGANAPQSSGGRIVADDWIGIGTNTKSASKVLDVVGESIFTALLRVNYVTASRPAKIDANKDIQSGLIDLASANDITGTLAIGNGGTGGATAAAARSNLSVYSIAEVDTALALKADKGTYTTTTAGGHTHDVTI